MTGVPSPFGAESIEFLPHPSYASRMLRAIAGLGVALAITAPVQGADPTPDAAYALMARSPWSKDPVPKPEEVAAARKVLEAQAAREPANARWPYALGFVASFEADHASGDAATAKRKESLERFEKAVSLQPNNAEYQCSLGNAAFERVDDVGMLSKMSLASQGRKAFERSVELDPNLVAPRVGLAQFFLGAPGIAGGSVDKAKAQGDALLAIAGKRGEFQGRMVLGGIAAHEKNWTEMSRQLTAAETAVGDGADPAVAMRSQAFHLLNEKNDVPAAVPVVERYVKRAAPDDLTAFYLDGEVKRLSGRCADALPRYDHVLEKYAAARGSRWGAAVCREQLGQRDAARRDYEEYARRFPNDNRAKEAKAAVKRLSGS